MKYVTLGKTGLKVSAVGLGGIPIQRTDVVEAKEVIKECCKQGINYLDTARGYTVSEEFFGEALKEVRKDWIIATKSMSRDYESMKKDVEISLNNLQTDYIDLYQFHNLSSDADFNTVFGDNGAYKALLEAKQEGKVNHIGATAHSLDSFKKLLEEYSDKIETIMFPFNIVESQAIELMKQCSEKNIGFIAMKPVAGGNIDNVSLGIKYCLNNEDCTIVIPGMGNVEEVKQNCSDTVFETLTEEEIKECDQIRKELGSEFCRRCGYCKPCPQGIDIPSNFVLVNYLRKYGLPEWAKGRYNAMKVNAKDCVQCGLCETRCPYNLPIRDMLVKVAKDME